MRVAAQAIFRGQGTPRRRPSRGYVWPSGENGEHDLARKLRDEKPDVGFSGIGYRLDKVLVRDGHTGGRLNAHRAMITGKAAALLS